MAYTPARSDLDCDGRHGLDSAVGRPDRGDPKGRCYLDSSGSETLARRRTKYSDDSHRNPGTARWQSRGVDGEGYRRAIPPLAQSSKEYFLSTYLRRLDPTVCESWPHDDSETTLRVDCARCGTKNAIPQQIIQTPRIRGSGSRRGLRGSQELHLHVRPFYDQAAYR